MACVHDARLLLRFYLGGDGTSIAGEGISSPVTCDKPGEVC